MSEDVLRAIKPPKFVLRMTDTRHGKRGCPNLLLNQAKPKELNQEWVYYTYTFKKWSVAGAAQATCVLVWTYFLR